jgi:hypothetical protein
MDKSTLNHKIPFSGAHAICILLHKQVRNKRWVMLTYTGTEVQLITKLFKNANI